MLGLDIRGDQRVPFAMNKKSPVCVLEKGVLAISSSQRGLRDSESACLAKGKAFSL